MEPDNVPVGAEPGALGLGVARRPADDLDDGLSFGKLPVQHGHGLPVADAGALPPWQGGSRASAAAGSRGRPPAIIARARSAIQPRWRSGVVSRPIRKLG